VVVGVEQQILKPARHAMAGWRAGAGAEPGSRKAFGLNGAQGAVVSQCNRSAAERAAQERRCDSESRRPSVATPGLAAVIAGHAPGSKVDLEIWRDRRSLHVTATLAGDEEESDADDSTGGAAEPPESLA